MRQTLRHLLFAVLLFAAQIAAGAHAVEHTSGGDGGLPPHACALCLEAHDLGTALPALPPVLVLAPAVTAFTAFTPAYCGACILPTPRQGAPPVA